MRFATFLDADRTRVAAVLGDRAVPLDIDASGPSSVREIAAAGIPGLAAIRAWLDERPDRPSMALAELELGPAIPDPGSIFAVGLNYGPASGPDRDRPQRPMVYAKLPGSVAGHGATLAWDRMLTANVDAEVELGVVIGLEAAAVTPEDAMAHVFGYTCINDVSSRDPWLDGDQWLLGKSMPGFCPVGPVIVTADEIDPTDLRLGCTINDIAIQDGSTSQLRFSIPEVIAYLSRHVVLRPGDLIATGTPARLAGPLGPDRHLQTGDVATVWIEGIGELTTTIA
ncbi:MAG: FAA hydrolase family protein [Chloroflexota bacterium]|nr:MAG: FAA hydrolase family protein [Chloroflexota bacterium]